MTLPDHHALIRVLDDLRQGDFSARIPETETESAALVHAINALAAELELRFRDLTEIHRLENIRKEFVASVSHELKTPLTSIRGYAETLRNGAVDDPQTARRFVEKIEDNAVRLQTLVEDILKLSEIESGRLELHPEPIVLDDMLDAVLKYFTDAASAKTIAICRDIPATLPRFPADPHALSQILSNLIDNAIKYTPEGGKVTLRAAIIGAGLWITVIDTGLGIPKGELSRVFERFYRVDKARSRAVGGTGLGLAIVKHLVQAHHGQVQVTSTLGKGSRFSFMIPLG